MTGKYKGYICAVKDCDRVATAQGWCPMHYRRWRRTGDPLATKSPKGQRRAEVFRLIAIETDECLPLSYSTTPDGYATISVNDRQVRAHVLACEMRNGPKPSPEMHAAHSCGVPNCVNPRHLRWATAKENCADKVGHGTLLSGPAHPRYTRTPEQIEQVLALRAQGYSYRRIAEVVGRSESNVALILRQHATRGAA